MPICQIKRDKDGEVIDVLAGNGKKSLAYKAILEQVMKTSGEELTPLRERFKAWEGKHIRDVNDPKELALAMYKQLYSPAFKEFFGDWVKFERLKREDPGDGWGIGKLSERVSRSTDTNGEPLITNGNIIGLRDKKKSIFNEGNFNTRTPNLYQQTGTPQTTPSKASPATLKKISEFTSRIGVDIHILQDLKVDGQKIGANGIADPLRGLIRVAQGKEDVALPEEAMHIAVELIQQKNPALFNQMMNSIGNYKLFNDVVQEYKELPDYQLEDGKPDIPKLKKETIAKVLAQTIIDKNEDTNENPDFLARVRTWWQKIVDFLKSLFLKANMNPFEETAESILKGEEKLGDVSSLKEDSGIFLQTQGLGDKLTEVNRNLAKVGETYELNGNKVRNTVFDRVRDYLKRRFRERPLPEIKQKEREFKQETEGRTQQDIQDILGRYIDDSGDIRQFPDPQVNPSAVSPYDSTFYNTLESHLAERLSTYPGGTKFYRSTNILDHRLNIAGTADLLAILPDGKIDILQFKAPILPRNATDIPLYAQESYNIEIEGLRSILQNGYVVDRKDFRQTRAIPIKVLYEFNTAGQPTSGLRVAKMSIGNTNVNLIKDDTLLAVPSTSETTGNVKFDKLISRLRGLVQKLVDERVTPDKRLEKTQGITSLLASIRKLQIQNKADGVLSSARTIIKRQQEKFTKLQETVKNTDPAQSSIADLNRIADDILDDKDQVELYSELYRTFKDIFSGTSPESQEYLTQARAVSDNAQDTLDNYWNMAVKFRTEKMAAVMNIHDDFRPEKNITAYRRLVRSLSQSPIKAGAILWGLVNNINNHFQLEFQDRFKNIEEIEKKVMNWLGGKNIKNLYSKIFQISPDGKWNGRIIQKFDKNFYTNLRTAQEKHDLKWVKDNVDIVEYEKWFLEEHQRRIDDSKTARVHEDDTENKNRIRQQLTEFVDTFNIKKAKGVNSNNYKIKDFPLENKWKSKEYQDLEKPENEPVLKLYEYWIDRLNESLESGMIEEHNGWSWFPNVRRNLLEKLTTAKGGAKFLSFLDDLRIEVEDTSFGKIDPLTGKSVDEVHANYVHDLGHWVKDANGNYFQDFSQKSMDLFKVMALWDREITKYKLKIESENMARLLAYTESGQSPELRKEAIKTGRTGKVLRNKDTGELITGPNDINAKYIQDHIDAVYYGKNLSDQSDVSFTIPYKGAVERINKFFGKEVLQVPEEENITISGVKLINSMNRFFVTKTLGINVFTALSNLFGGTINSFLNQGLFMTKTDLLESEAEYVSGRFWKNEKMAGLIEYLHPYLEDKTTEEIRKLSVSGAVRRLSSDHLFYLQRGSDNWVNEIIAMAFIKNTMVKDGKFVNIREFVRKEMGHGAKWSGTYEQGKEFEKELEKRVKELKSSPEALINIAQVVNDEIKVPGIERISPTTIALRQSMLQFVKDALGNTSREDLSLYKRSVIWQSFFMFKNWIPRMLDVRGQSLKYDPGSQKYEWGRIRMLGRAIRGLGLRSVSSLLKQLGGNDKNIVEVAKRIYKEKQKYFAEQEQDFDMSEGEFVDMFVKGVRSEFKELALALGLMGILVAARLASPDKKDSAQLKGAYKWMLRGIDKLQDEVSFFYNPTSFTDIVNGSVFPAVGMLADIEKFLKTGIAKSYYTLIGDDQAANRQKMSKYVFKILPVSKELMTYVAIFDNDIAKEYGIKISSQNGSSR